MKKSPETKKSPTPTPAKKSGEGLPKKSPKGSGKSVALAVAEFDASEVGRALLADPLLVDCYRMFREDGEDGNPFAQVIAWRAKIGLQRPAEGYVPPLSWDAEKRDFCPSPRLVAYRLRRSKADAEPVLPREGWDEAFAELILDVVRERVRKAERCPAAGA